MKIDRQKSKSLTVAGLLLLFFSHTGTQSIQKCITHLLHSKGQQHSSNDFSSDSNKHHTYLAQNFETTIQTRTRNGTTCNDTATQEHTPTHTHGYSILTQHKHCHTKDGYTWMQQRHILRTYMTYNATLSTSTLSGPSSYVNMMRKKNRSTLLSNNSQLCELTCAPRPST
jgi:hypothetical protein